MNLAAKQAIFARNVANLILYINYHNYSVTLGEVYRTQEQAKLYAEQGKGIISSQHCKRLAIDLNLFDKNGIYLQETENYKDIGTYWKYMHPDNRWGGDFQKADGNHFEMVG